MNGDTENNRRFCSLTRAGRRARMRDLSPPRATSISCMDQRLLLFNFFPQTLDDRRVAECHDLSKVGRVKKSKHNEKNTHTEIAQ